MNPSRRAPQSLKTVAYTFLVEGFLWLALPMISIVNGDFWLSPFIFFAPIGWGLLKLDAGCYRWAHGFVLLTLFLLLCAGATLLFDAHVAMAIWHARFMVIVGSLVFALKLWQLRVLHSPPVRRAFSLPDED